MRRLHACTRTVCVVGYHDAGANSDAARSYHNCDVCRENGFVAAHEQSELHLRQAGPLQGVDCSGCCACAYLPPPESCACSLRSSTRALHGFGLGLSAVCAHVLSGRSELQLNNQNRRQDMSILYIYICINVNMYTYMIRNELIRSACASYNKQIHDVFRLVILDRGRCILMM